MLEAYHGRDRKPKTVVELIEMLQSVWSTCLRNRPTALWSNFESNRRLVLQLVVDTLNIPLTAINDFRFDSSSRFLFRARTVRPHTHTHEVTVTAHQLPPACVYNKRACVQFRDNIGPIMFVRSRRQSWTNSVSVAGRVNCALDAVDVCVVSQVQLWLASRASCLPTANVSNWYRRRADIDPCSTAPLAPLVDFEDS